MEACLGLPARTSHTRAPMGLLGRCTPDCLKSCSLLTLHPNFVSAWVFILPWSSPVTVTSLESRLYSVARISLGDLS